MKSTFRYGIQRKSDKKFYKNPTAIYFDIEEYWTDDMSRARLWLYKPTWATDFDSSYKIVTFKLTLTTV